MFPVLVACGACGNVHDLIFVLGSSFGLVGLLAFGQYVWEQVQRLMGRRRLTPDLIDSAVCVVARDREREVRATTPAATDPERAARVCSPADHR